MVKNTVKKMVVITKMYVIKKSVGFYFALAAWLLNTQCCEPQKEVNLVEIAIFALLIFGAIIFVASFFKKDRFADVENQMENMSITLMQELYKVKKKQKQLEEEMLIDHDREM